MKRLWIVLACLIAFGCSTLPPGLIEHAQQTLQEQGVTIDQGDLEKALAILVKIRETIPSELQTHGHLAQLMAALESYRPPTPPTPPVPPVTPPSTNTPPVTPPSTNVPPVVVPPVVVPPVYPDGSLFAGFLLNDAKIRVMNKLSINASAEDYTALLKAMKSFGFNQIPLFLANEGDGGPVPTTIYRDKWFGSIDQSKVDLICARIDEAKAMGFSVELWGRADDSPSLDKATTDQLVQMYTDYVRLFGSRADTWCVGLEIDEWGKTWWNAIWHDPDMSMVQKLVDVLETSGKPVGIHLTSYKNIELAHQSGATRFHAQFGWLDSASEMGKAMDWINARKGNLHIVASEFNRDSVTALATALATEAMKKGAVGTQTGRPK